MKNDKKFLSQNHAAHTDEILWDMLSVCVMYHSPLSLARVVPQPARGSSAEFTHSTILIH